MNRYCYDPRHETPCPLPCQACEEECHTTERFGHLNLERLRKSVSKRDFDFFVKFVGADQLGFTEEDLDP